MRAFAWAAVKMGTEPPPEVFCVTRDVALARVQTLHTLLKKSAVHPNAAALLAAIAAELVSNCFDHNLGAWRDIAGCWFEYYVRRDEVRIIVGDRGQGFLGSLRRVRPDLAQHRDALLAGFTVHVSGRAPEQRGRGLSFIIESLEKLPGTFFRLQTGDANLAFISPVVLRALAENVERAERSIPGTYAELTFRRPADSLSSP